MVVSAVDIVIFGGMKTRMTILLVVSALLIAVDPRTCQEEINPKNSISFDGKERTSSQNLLLPRDLIYRFQYAMYAFLDHFFAEIGTVRLLL